MAMSTNPGIASLPTELVLQILSYLEPADLANVARTCKILHGHSYDDQLWQPLISRNLPEPISTCHPLSSFRDLFVAHHPHWFLPQQRIWFADGSPSGKLLLSRYEPSTGSIAAYTITATRQSDDTVYVWEKNPHVFILPFHPEISLHLDRPEVNLRIDGPKDEDLAGRAKPAQDDEAESSRYTKEKLMYISKEAGLYTSFILCRALPSSAVNESTGVWPPLRIPAEARTRNRSGDNFRSSGHRPTALSEVSQNTFRLRRWVEYTGRTLGGADSASPSIALVLREMHRRNHALRWSSSGHGPMSYRTNEDILTYSTLLTSSYVPTAKKPWQGIWCGDYGGHGCEFLLIQQPSTEDARPLPDGMDWLQPWFEGDRGFTSAGAEAGGNGVGAPPVVPISASSNTKESNVDEVPSGRLEAIKLTGDPNVPRGEFTFICPDVGPKGLLRVADEGIFRGARVVRSAGHIANNHFQNDRWTPSQLIMISHDTLAQFWERMNHISYYRRVDLDGLMKYTASTSSDESNGE